MTLRRRLHNLILFVYLGSLLACTNIGYWIPIPGPRVEVDSTVVADDTAVVEINGVKLRIWGDFDDTSSGFDVFIDNNRSEPVIFVAKEVTLQVDGGNKNLVTIIGRHDDDTNAFDSRGELESDEQGEISLTVPSNGQIHYFIEFLSILISTKSTRIASLQIPLRIASEEVVVSVRFRSSLIRED